MGNTAGLVTSKITKITSSVPMSVYACYLVSAASDCTNFYPKATWGSRYRYLYAKSQFGSTYPEQVTVISGSETATLTIRPKTTVVASTGTYSANTNYTVTVPPNTIWQTNNTNANEDFSGMLISSSSQISLIAGAQCENFSTTFSGAGGACDASIQAVPPISSWGSKFYSTNYRNTGSSGSGYRITTDLDSTTVTITGDHTESKTINAGEIFQFIAYANTGSSPNKSIVITSSNPVLVGHYMFNGAYESVGGSDNGDPSMSYVTPFQQFLDRYTVVNPPNVRVALMNLVVPASETTTIRLDGAAISSSLFRTIAGTTWMSAQVQVAVGTHNLSARQAFGVEIYGAGSFDSYAYTGGQSLSVVSDVASLSLITSSVSGVVGQQACVRVEVLDSNGAPVAGVRVDATISGASGSIATNATANSSGIANICYTGTASGSDTVSLTANGFSASTVVSWTLALPNISYSPNTLSLGTNEAMPTLSATNSGGTSTSWSVSPSLPTGLSINSSTGAITGTPTTSQSSTSYTITATNATGSATTTLDITVVAPFLTSIAYGSSRYDLTLDTETAVIRPSVVGTFPTWSISPTLPSGLSLNTQNGEITGTPDRVTSVDTFTVTARNSSDSKTATIQISVVPLAPSISVSPSSYTFYKDIAITSITPRNSGSPATSWSISPSLPSGLSLNQTSGSISGTPSATSSSTTYTVTATNITGTSTATFSMSVTLSLPAPDISYSPSDIVGEVNTAISTLSPTNVGGTATSWSISPALPDGLSISSGTGRINGTPTSTSASATYTITASNTTGSDTATITVLVNAAAVALPSITYSAGTVSASVGSAITPLTVTNTGGAVASWAISPAPPSGLTFELSSGTISGTPTVSVGSTVYTISATNSRGTVRSTITLVVTGSGGGGVTAPGAPTIGTATAVNATTVLLTFTAPASNGGATIDSYTATSSPGGIVTVLNQSGSGTFTISGLTEGTAYTFTVKAFNSAGASSASGSSNSVTPTASAVKTAEQIAAEAEAARKEAERIRAERIQASRNTVWQYLITYRVVPEQELLGCEYGVYKSANITSAFNEYVARKISITIDFDTSTSLFEADPLFRFFVKRYSVIELITGPNLVQITSTELIEYEIMPKDQPERSRVTSRLKLLPLSNRRALQDILNFFSTERAKFEARRGLVATKVLGTPAPAGAQSEPVTATEQSKNKTINIYFEMGSSVISASQSKSLKGALANIDKKKILSIYIQGFVQKTTRQVNDEKLPRLRAQSVATFIKKLGITTKPVISSGGYAKEKDSRARRVEITIKISA
jgi:hypothetical protein